jgi:quercetin dioxygenase-like cupin family protein
MKKLFSKRRLTIALVFGVLIISVITVQALTSVRLATGIIPSSEVFNGPTEVTVTHITMQPGDTIPWHYHPGKVYVVLQSGTITEDEGCGGSEVFTAGQAFEEPIPRVHQVRNTGATAAELYVTFLTPSGQPRTVNTAGPLCGPPKEKDQCKEDGWMVFNFPRSFENEGDCVSLVQAGK